MTFEQYEVQDLIHSQGTKTMTKLEQLEDALEWAENRPLLVNEGRVKSIIKAARAHLEAMKQSQANKQLVAGKTIEQWQEFARRDDCLEQMVPSDLRQILSIGVQAIADRLKEFAQSPVNSDTIVMAKCREVIAVESDVRYGYNTLGYFLSQYLKNEISLKVFLWKCDITWLGSKELSPN